MDLTEMFGKELGKGIADIFKSMEVAEEEIARAQEEYPKQKDLLWNCFKLLIPSELLGRPVRENAYRWHCQELLWRVANGGGTKELEVVTDGELMAVFAATSMRAVLITDAGVAYNTLFRKWAPEEAQKLDDQLGDLGPRETHPGAADEVIGRLRKKYSPVTRNDYPEMKQGELL